MLHKIHRQHLFSFILSSIMELVDEPFLRPPPSPQRLHQEITADLTVRFLTGREYNVLLIPSALTNENKIIMGDFNINIQNKNHSTTKKICENLGTKQLINTPTTKYNTIIDHIYTNIPNHKECGVIKTYYSDHDQIFIQI